MRPLLLALICAAAHAQIFDSLAVTGDGSQVYFRTVLRLNTEPADRYYNASVIYRLAGGVFERRTTPSAPAGPYETDGNPQVSADGAVFAYTHYRNCVGGSSCIGRPSTSESYIAAGGKTIETVGTAQVSRNGRYVLSAQVFGYTLPPRENVVKLYDLENGSSVDVPLIPAAGRQAVSSDGRVLGFDPNRHLTLWSSRSSRELPVRDAVSYAIMDDAVTWAVYSTYSKPAELHALEIATGRDTVLAADAQSPSISDDGAAVLYRSGRQLWLVRPGGVNIQPFTTLHDVVDDAVLSGNGRVAVAITGGRIVAVDTAPFGIRELIPTTPVCRAEFRGLTPGAVLPFRGFAMASATETAAFPLPGILGGFVLRLNDQPAPLLSVSPSEIWFQVPFELRIGSVATLEVPNFSVFNGCPVVRRTVVERAPYFFGDGILKAAHENFAGLVAFNSPALPGEIVTVWGVGLGLTAPQPPNGLPTPSSPPFPLVNPFECHAGRLETGLPLDVVFAGLAPGMIGIHQVSVRLPNEPPPDGFLFLNCGTPGNAFERHGGTIPMLRANRPGGFRR